MTENQAKDPRIDLWRSLINGNKPWVLFEHGTCLIISEPEADLVAQARQIMAASGPVHAGSSFGDFTVYPLNEPFEGWLVGGHHPGMYNYVSPQDSRVGTGSADILVGIYGREDRDADAHSVKVIDVEDTRVGDS